MGWFGKSVKVEFQCKYSLDCSLAQYILFLNLLRTVYHSNLGIRACDYNPSARAGYKNLGKGKCCSDDLV